MWCIPPGWALAEPNASHTISVAETSLPERKPEGMNTSRTDGDLRNSVSPEPPRVVYNFRRGRTNLEGMKKGISIETYETLFAESGGHCANPECGTDLFEPAASCFAGGIFRVDKDPGERLATVFALSRRIPAEDERGPVGCKGFSTLVFHTRPGNRQTLCIQRFVLCILKGFYTWTVLWAYSVARIPERQPCVCSGRRKR